MKKPLICIGAIFAILSATLAHGATLYVDLYSANPTPPYSDWSIAATNIQDAIDASTDGDQVWVTNGVYQTGGKVMAGDLTNRVALNKAVTVQSVNGPFVTTIAGAGATNGTVAVRCAWLTNNAALIGFTLTRGATRTSGDSLSLETGGGTWCSSSSSQVRNCVVVSNTAAFRAGGAYQGSLSDCLISSNGISGSPLNAAVYGAVLNNSTVMSNAPVGINQCSATNSIIYYNSATSGNYSGGNLSFCCTTPLPFGTGNITNAPQLFPDGIHLSTVSPCIGAGATPAVSTDIFGNAWANPPSLGCAEAGGALLVAQPQIRLTSSPVGFMVGNTPLSGSGPFTFNWLKDGAPLQDNGHFSSTQSTNLIAMGVNFTDAGSYQVVVSNASGAVTSAVAQVVIHCVDSAGLNPAAPFTNWATAATNIQDAITAAAAGEIVLVTNGVYGMGGKSMDGVITNRVSLDKAILVQSVNGPSSTVIQGAWDPTTTNGPAAVRCVWMTNNSILSGFTISGGATFGISASLNQSMNGGGVWGALTNATVDNCVITNNYASNIGGGAYSAALNHCVISGNHALGSGTAGSGVAGAGSGGGAANCRLRNCVVSANLAHQSNGGGTQNCNSTNCAFVNNRAPLFGSGSYQGTLINCTLVNNTSGGYGGYGGAAASATLNNCIVYGNFNIGPGSTNYASCTFSYSDTDPLPAGTGNIDVDPQLIADNIHLAVGSPCIGAATTNGLTGTDIDRQSWNTSPSIGCDEWQPTPVVAIPPTFRAGAPSHRALGFNSLAAGQPPFSYFWFKDGTPIQDDARYGNSTATNLTVNNFEPADAGAYQLVVSNSFGVVTSQVAQVVIRVVDAFGSNPVPPFSTWQNAATNIQDAIDAASAGEIVLVTNGIYAAGGKVIVSDLTNRVAIDKALTVISVNGYASTIIEGQWDSSLTNGPGAIRGAWLADGALLNGFTIRNGATRGGNSFSLGLQYGGGAWLSTNAVVSNCVLTNNSARYAGGGAAFGTVLNSFMIGNTVQLGYGGGAYQVRLNNCTIRENHCFLFNGGAGVDSCNAKNCIITDNYYALFDVADYQLLNYYSGGINKFTNCCTSPLPFSGSGNISASPIFLDTGFRLAPSSPGRAAGSALYATGNDLDNEPFNNPPSMGCDEFVEANQTGPLSFTFVSPWTATFTNFSIAFAAIFDGNVSQLEWSFGDGTILTNAGYFARHAWTNTGLYTVTLTAYNLDHPEGVSSNFSVFVDTLASPTLAAAGVVNNCFQFTFQGQTNGGYVVQYATNLVAPVSWQFLTSSFSPGGPITIQDPSVTNTTGARFYRVQSLP